MYSYTDTREHYGLMSLKRRGGRSARARSVAKTMQLVLQREFSSTFSVTFEVHADIVHVQCTVALK
jgi:hypothetical protein